MNQWTLLECHHVPRLPHETMLRDVWNLQKLQFGSTRQRHGHSALIANGCRRLQTVLVGCDGCRPLQAVADEKQRRANTSTPLNENPSLHASGKKLWPAAFFKFCWKNIGKKDRLSLRLAAKSFPTSNVFPIRLLHTHGVHWRAPRRRHNRLCPCLATLD